MGFRDKLDRFHRLRDRSISLSVLLWGPGSTNPILEKRKKIQSHLQGIFGTSVDVRMSEDSELKEWTGGPTRNEADEELEQALAADLILVLDLGKGAGEEIARYGDSPRLAYKMFILTPEKYSAVKSMPSSFRDRLECYKYKDEEFDRCDLRGVCEDRVKVEMNRRFLDLPP